MANLDIPIKIFECMSRVRLADLPGDADWTPPEED